MAKIGTAHVEIKPVLNEEALNAICQTVEAAIRQAVQVGLGEMTPQQAADLSGLCTCADKPHAHPLHRAPRTYA